MEVRRDGTHLDAEISVDSFMESTLTLQAEEASLFLVHSGFELASRMHVPDRDVALIPKGVVGEIVAFQILEHIFVRPINYWVDLDAVAVPDENGGRFSGRGLAASDS